MACRQASPKRLVEEGKTWRTTAWPTLDGWQTGPHAQGDHDKYLLLSKDANVFRRLTLDARDCSAVAIVYAFD